jgi:two-component system, OmpR family, response regulator QseB
MRVLIIEDDEIIGDGIQDGLRRDGYTVDLVRDGLLGDQILKTENFDAIVLDLGLPKLNGIRVLENLRLRGNKTPVLILTAKDNIDDKIKGLDMGADDYMIKPFDLSEVSARLRALQRRALNRANPELQYKDIRINPVSHEVFFKDELIALPRREFSLLQKLVENQGKVLSREQLTHSLYHWDEDVDSNALEVHVHNLRKKFGAELVRTIRGVGYIIEKDKDQDAL